MLKPEKTIYFEDFGMEDFVCTGLTYDSDNDRFWIADYGYIEGEDKVNPRLINVPADFSRILKIILILETVGDKANVQGIAYDCSDNNIWLATGKEIISIDKNGEIQKKLI